MISHEIRKAIISWPECAIVDPDHAVFRTFFICVFWEWLSLFMWQERSGCAEERAALHACECCFMYRGL